MFSLGYDHLYRDPDYPGTLTSNRKEQEYGTEGTAVPG